MNYRTNAKNGDQLSILGFGCMRFPTRGSSIDEPRAEALLLSAIEQGVNYFDTAYIYHGGKSESFLGKVLSKGYREQVKIATKLPHFMVRTAADLDKIFERQLQRLQTSWVDYYLIHMLSDTGTWERLKALGIEAWIERKKAGGQIRNIGFSFHGVKDQFIKLVDIYAWDFCQIQYNYLDVNNQAGRDGLLHAAARGLPVIIMEPLRGGKIVTALPPQVNQIWRDAKPERSIAEWALRWIWNHPEATVVLSGMSDEQQVADNIRTASSAEANAMSLADLALFDQARTILNQNIKIACTGCGYCMPCPAGVDIPACFALYNEKHTLGLNQSRFMYIRNSGAMTAHPAYASLCTSCGQCEPHCPQQISIREQMGVVAGDMEGFFFKPIVAIARKIMRVK